MHSLDADGDARIASVSVCSSVCVFVHVPDRLEMHDATGDPFDSSSVWQQVNKNPNANDSCNMPNAQAPAVVECWFVTNTNNISDTNNIPPTGTTNKQPRTRTHRKRERDSQSIHILYMPNMSLNVLSMNANRKSNTHSHRHIRRIESNMQKGCGNSNMQLVCRRTMTTKKEGS